MKEPVDISSYRKNTYEEVIKKSKQMAVTFHKNGSDNSFIISTFLFNARSPLSAAKRSTSCEVRR